MRRALPRIRRYSGWCYFAGFLVCTFMLVGTTAYPLALESRERIFWCAWIFGMVVGVVLLRWIGESPDIRYRTTFYRIWFAWRNVGRSVAWGTGIGIFAFSVLVMANGVCAREETEIVDGVIVMKAQHQGKKGGVSYTIKVRAGRTGETYEHGVSFDEYDGALLGANRPLVLRRGFFGWAFRVE
jgi:hypothetical protein